MADSTGGGKDKRKTPHIRTRKTIGRRKREEASKAKTKAAADEVRTRKAEPPASEDRPPKAGPGDWDEFAEKAQATLGEAGDKAAEYAKKGTEQAKKIAVDLSQGFDKAFGKLRDEAAHMVKKGQHTRVKIKFRGKELAELPVAVVAAAELASLWWAGPLRLLLAHVVGKAVLDVEFVNDSQSHVAAGKAFLSSGDLDDAKKAFERALAMDAKSAGAHLGMGIVAKLKGDKDTARKHFVLAEEHDPRSEAGREARRHLDNLG